MVFLYQNKKGSLRFIVGIGFALTLLFVGVGGFYWYKQNQKVLPKHVQQLKEREKAPINFPFYDLSFNKKSLIDFKGKVVLLNFWATWCAPCVEELPALNKLAKHYHKKIVILALSNERTEDIKNFLMAFPNFQSNFVIGNVSRKKMLIYFPVRAFPETYIIGPFGHLKKKVIGPKKWDSTYWKNQIKTFIKQ